MKIGKILKGVFLGLVLIISAHYTYARMADPNRQPDLEPLRLPAANVQPNYQNSVNSVVATSSEKSESQEENQDGKNFDMPEDINKTYTQNTSSNQFYKSGSWMWLVLILVSLALVGYYIFYQKKKK